MAQTNASELERLIETIAVRVKGRLLERGMLVSAPSPSVSGLDEHDACGIGSCSCGLPSTMKHDPELVSPVGDLLPQEIAKVIDHTLLKPDASREQIEQLCREARSHGFFSVCVNSAMVHLARSLLHGSTTKVCAVVGFPLGAATSGSKAYEAREAIRCGADEIDMVVNIGALKSRDYALVEQDIARVVKAVQPKPVKVILETSKLDHDQKVIVCALAKSAGAAFVKTSTGFGGGGATVEDVKLMRRVVGPDVGVKASGGVRDYATALLMLRAGANRLGLSSSVDVVSGKRGRRGGRGGGY